MSVANSADYLSANCFLNAYIREFKHWSIRNIPHKWHLGDEQALVIPFNQQNIWIGMPFQSDCGRHRFSMPGIIADASHQIISELDFLSLAKYLLLDAGNKNPETVSTTATEKFWLRVQESHANIQECLQQCEPRLHSLFNSSLDFLASEQSLLSGHSVHPAPKVRQPMNKAEGWRYGPNREEGFPLAWLAVHTDRLDYHSATSHTLPERVQSLTAADSLLEPLGWNIPVNHIVLPMHPWQLAQLEKLPALRAAFANKELIPLGEGGHPWYATSSMRSLYATNAPYMLKYSLSVRLTNSIRHLQPAELERGCLISKILAHPAGKQFLSSVPRFCVIEEPAYVMLKDDEGRGLVETGMVFRDNPLQKKTRHNKSTVEKTDSNVCVLAGITQDHPHGEPSQLSYMVYQCAKVNDISVEQAALVWFQNYLAVAVKPLILAQANFGILFGAHQQNILLKIELGVPTHCYFRDCQGTGFSQLGADLFSIGSNGISNPANNHLDDDMGNKLFAYYLIINATFAVISTMAVDGLISEEKLLSHLRGFLTTMLEDSPRDSSFLEYVLHSPRLWQKGNFLCSLADMNENTMPDPLAIYQPIRNPLFSAKVHTLLNSNSNDKPDNKTDKNPLDTVTTASKVLP